MIINEMAISRKDMIADMTSKRQLIIRHILKVYFYPNHRDRDHWLKEISTWCAEFDDLLLKNNKRPSENDYLKYLLREVETPSDLAPVASTVEPTIDYDTMVVNARDFISKWRRLRSELAKMMSSKDIHSRSDYQNVIKKYM